MTVELTGPKIRHALRRKASRMAGSDTLWRIEGAPDLDSERWYAVRWDPDADPPTFECSCGAEVDDIPGSTGRTPGCVHVAAAVLAQKREAARLAVARERALEHEGYVAERDTPIPLPSEARFTPPGEAPFPEWAQTFRRQQWKAIEAVAGCFDEGAKVVMLQAPVGSGKTLTAETVRRIIGGRGLYVCSTKTLQDQAARDFPYARVLKGRANYPTLDGGDQRFDAWGRAVASPDVDAGNRITAADCTATGGVRTCRWCDPTVACPYRVARTEAQQARLAILNTSYFLADANKGGGKFAGRDLVIADEADLLEGELLNQTEVYISERRMARLGIQPPDRKTSTFQRDGVKTDDPARAWLPWVTEEAIPKVRARIAQLPLPEQARVRELKERNGLSELLERLTDLAVELPEGGWVFDGYDRGNVIFRPIEVGKWGSRLLWPHGKRFLLMSGSIISADEMADSLGLDSGYRFIDVPMTFPTANRPVNIVAVAEVTNKNQRQAWPKIAQGLAGVLATHPDERVLVHTVSYPFATFLAGEMRKAHPGRPIVTYDGARGRDEALGRYKATPGAVLVAPSMDRGVDLPDDLCRVQVIAKIPYPNLGDKRTEARLWRTPGGKAWYAVNTVRSLVQMTGRGVRGPDDFATTYILDHSFTTNVWRKSRSLLPSWWVEATNFRFPAQRLIRAGKAAAS